MKRRNFIRAASALAGSATLNPGLALGAITQTNLTMTANYTPYMQAHALAWIRAHGQISYRDFLRMTNLNTAQAEAMLGRFIKSGFIQANSLRSGVIGAIRPDWMKAQSGVAKMASQIPSRITDEAAKNQAHNSKRQTQILGDNETIIKEGDDETQELSSLNHGSGDDGDDTFVASGDVHTNGKL